MKRSATAVGVGLALLTGVAGSLVLFPNVVGARSSHAAASQPATRATRVQIVQVSAPLTSSRDLLRTGVRTRVASRTGQLSRFRSSLRAAPRVGRGTMRYTRSGSLYRTGVRYTGAGQYGTLYRTGTYAGYARTGHNCPGMSARTSTGTSTTTGK